MRAYVLGLDGATFDLIEPYVRLAGSQRAELVIVYHWEESRKTRHI
jgi:hypothetical protein